MRGRPGAPAGRGPTDCPACRDVPTRDVSHSAVIQNSRDVGALAAKASSVAPRNTAVATAAGRRLPLRSRKTTKRPGVSFRAVARPIPAPAHARPRRIAPRSSRTSAKMSMFSWPKPRLSRIGSMAKTTGTARATANQGRPPVAAGQGRDQPHGDHHDDEGGRNRGDDRGLDRREPCQRRHDECREGGIREPVVAVSHLERVERPAVEPPQHGTPVHPQVEEPVDGRRGHHAEGVVPGRHRDSPDGRHAGTRERREPRRRIPRGERRHGSTASADGAGRRPSSG